MTDCEGVSGDNGQALPRLRHDHPLWRIWTSDTGRLYATRAGISVDEPGASVTVDGLTETELRKAITDVEWLADRYGSLMI